jgi:hypothetical protein
MSRPSVPDALLRLWILAALGLAGLHGWLAWRMRDWPADLPGPQPLRSVAITEFMLLFIILPAAVVVATRWRVSRDRPLAGLALLYALASAASFAAWSAAGDAGTMRALHWLDAGIALAGIPVAVRALRV